MIILDCYIIKVNRGEKQIIKKLDGFCFNLNVLAKHLTLIIQLDVLPLSYPLPKTDC